MEDSQSSQQFSECKDTLVEIYNNAVQNTTNYFAPFY